MFFFRTNDAGGGQRFFRTNEANVADVQGVTDAESVASVSAIGFKLVTFAAPFNFSVASLFAPFRYTGAPANGDTCRYPSVNGLVIDPDGRLHADSNDINVTVYYNNGGGETPFNLIIDDSAQVIVTSVTESESVPSVSATGGVAGNASVAGVIDTESVPPVSATGGVAGNASVSGVTENETVPTPSAAGGGAANVQSVTDQESVPTETATGGANASVQGVTDVESVPAATASSSGNASVQGVTDAETVPAVTARIEAEVSGVNDQETIATPSASGSAVADVTGTNDQEIVAPVAATEIPESVYAQAHHMITTFGNIEIIQLTDKDNLGVMNLATLAKALAGADAEIDGYLEGRYQLPLKKVPAVLTLYACDIARYRLYDDRATEQVTKRYDSAIKFLAMVAQRKMNLGVSEPAQETAPSAGGPTSSAPNRTFTDSNLSDFLGNS